MTAPMLDPVVEVGTAEEVAPDVIVIPSRGVEFVPNISIVGGSEAVLIVDTGLGASNALRVLEFAHDYARGRRLYLTTTHFHPEHAFGSSVIAEQATYLVNRAQHEDLTLKGSHYLDLFRGFGQSVARRLDNVVLVEPNMVYGESFDLDLGGRLVRLSATGRAHTRGDQVIVVPDAEVMLTGDLAETGQFAIFPWYPPHDVDVSGIRWIAVMEQLIVRQPKIVVPGHGNVGDTRRLTDVLEYLALLRDETWKRRDSAMSEDTIASEVRASMLALHPDWIGQEWIKPGVACFCSEHLDRLQSEEDA